MKAPTLTFASALALMFAAVPSFAADDETVAAIEKSKGSILASEGSEGEFLPTQLGQRVKSGDRLMVVEGSQVTIKYDNNCDRTYKEPGVYLVDSDCIAAARFGTGKIVLASALAAGAIYEFVLDDDDDVAPPVSR